MKLRPSRLILALLLAAGAATAQADALTDQAKRLLDAKEPAKAYALLQPQEAQRAGDPDFDYLLGLAALDSGNAERAVFAFERVLAMRPNFSQARAEMARAHAALGDRGAARAELETVRKTATDMPSEARAAIDRFLDALSRPPTAFSAFIEGVFGVDSNINSATGSGSLAIPTIGVVQLNAGAIKLGDTFTGVNVGASVLHPIDERWALTGGVRAGMRVNSGGTVNTGFDTSSLDVDGGVRWSDDKDTFSAGIQAQSFVLDENRYRDSAGPIGQWQRNLSDTQQISAFVQWSDLNYVTQPVRDAERTIGGVAYAQAFNVPLAPVMFLSAYTGVEKERNQGVPHLGHDPFGVRAGVQFTLMPDELFLNLFASHESRRYGGNEPLFGFARRDRQTDLRASLTWKFSPGWSLTPAVSFTDNRSNVNLFKYDRTVGSISLRKDF